MGSPVDSNHGINKRVDDHHYSAKELRQRLEQETRRSRSRAVNPTEITLTPPRFNSSNISFKSNRTSLGRLPARNIPPPSSSQKRQTYPLSLVDDRARATQQQPPQKKHTYPLPLTNSRVRATQLQQAAAMATPENEDRINLERQVTAAIISRSTTQVSLKAFEWCGIPLDEAFICPTSRHLMAPEEHNGIFKSKKHARQYGKLVRALMKETERLKLQQKDDLKAERARCQTERDAESNEFHAEFLARLSWGQPGCVLSLDPESLKEYMDRLGKEKLDSKFPTINQYFRKFPTLSIAWAVDDFYKWQNARYLENENLLRIRHLWDWYETCYKFMHAAYLLRKEHETTLQSWFYCLNSKSKLPNEEQRKAAEAVEWTPERDEQRKMLQYITIKKIWKMCTDSGFQFPLDFCPGGTTPMAYFRSRSEDLDFSNPKTLFLRSHTRFDRRTIEGLEVENEVETMLSNYNTPQEYYKQHPCSLGNVVWECRSIRDDINENDILHNINDEVISLDLDDYSPDNSMSTPLPSTCPASVSGWIETTSFKRTYDSPKWSDGWRNIRVCGVATWVACLAYPLVVTYTSDEFHQWVQGFGGSGAQ